MGTPWKMPLAKMGSPTGDRRAFDPHAIEHLSLPLPFRYVAQDAGAHAQARVVGRIDKIDYAEADGQPTGSGVFFDDDDAPEATREGAKEAMYLADQGVIGPSVDLDSAQVEGRMWKPARTIQQAATEQSCGCGGDHTPSRVDFVTKGRMRGATLVAVPAFAELASQAIIGPPSAPPDPNVSANAGETVPFSIAEFVALYTDADLTEPDEADGEFAVDENVGGGVDRAKLDASDFIDPKGRRFPIVTPQDVRDAVSSYGRAKPLIPMARFRARLTAIAERKGQAFVDALPKSWDSVTASLVAAASAPPERPPAAWFDNPKLTGPTPLTITDDGRVFGHVATWGTCHTGIGNACITPPRSRTGYAYFHTGELETAEGRRIPVGRLTYGGGHAGPRLGYAAAAEHYDSTSAVGAYVRAGDDEHGIWVAGSMSPTAPSSAYATMRAAPLSGDWRRVAGNLEMVAALHVNTAGFPIPRAVMASGVPVSLIAAGALEATAQAPEGGAADVADIVRRTVAELRDAERQEQARAHSAGVARDRLVASLDGVDLDLRHWRQDAALRELTAALGEE